MELTFKNQLKSLLVSTKQAIANVGSLEDRDTKICEIALPFIKQLTPTQDSKLVSVADKLFSLPDCEVAGINLEEYPSLASLLVLMFDSEELKDATLPFPTGERQLDITPWEQHEGNSTNWFANEVRSERISDPIRFYLLKVNVEETTDMTSYAIFRTSSTDTEIAHLALYSYAQAFMDGEYDADNDCFISSDVKAIPFDIVEITEHDAELFLKLTFARQYDSIDSINANMYEVGLAM